MTRRRPDSPALLRAEARAAAAITLGLLVAFTLRPRPQPQPIVARTLVVDLNHAPLDELCALPGIGRKTAARLLTRRPIRDWAEVEAVLGRARLRRLRPFLRLE